MVERLTFENHSVKIVPRVTVVFEFLPEQMHGKGCGVLVFGGVVEVLNTRSPEGLALHDSYKACRSSVVIERLCWALGQE